MAENPQVVPAKAMRCGGPTDARALEKEDQALFEEFRDIIEEKVQAQFQVPKDFKIEPTKVRTQVVAGVNYLFNVRLPNDQFAHIKIFKPLKGHALEKGDRSSFVTVDKETTND